ncbi:MAG: FmdE family protein [Euryarchaeota archaeon]|nr:FmdE family protein [Euryarchaeota archaeon]
MKEIKRVSSVAVVIGLLLLGALVLCTGVGVADSAKEETTAADIQKLVGALDEDAHDLVNVSKAIHDNTEKIADDEDLDDALRDKAEAVHIASHDLWQIAGQIQVHAEELDDLARDPEANKTEIEDGLAGVVEDLEEYYAVLEAKQDLMHQVLFTTPDSHMEYADAMHDAFHEAEAMVEHLTEEAQELAEVVGVAIPGSAIKPVEVPEQYIRMYDEQGELLVLSAEEVAIEAHGHLCVCGATAFRVAQVAISQLWGEEIPTKGALEVTYQHPGKGHKEVFEYLLGPENVTYVKTGDPKHLTLGDNFVYTFVRKDTGATVEMQMKEGVIPEDFFDLRYEVKGFLKGWHEEQPTEAEKAAFKQRFDEVVNNILSMEASEVFEGVGVGEIASEYQEDIEDLAASAKDLKKLIRRMTAPAHAIPGDVGGAIHTQFHRVEGFAVAIYDNVKELEGLAGEPQKNKEEIRELVVKELYGQVNSQWGGLSAAVSGMSDLIDQALSADPGDANALKVQDILVEIEDVQFEMDEQVKELGEKVQDPIVWQCKCMSPANPRRLENGNTLIAEHVGDRIIEVTPGGISSGSTPML